MLEIDVIEEPEGFLFSVSGRGDLEGETGITLLLSAVEVDALAEAARRALDGVSSR